MTNETQKTTQTETQTEVKKPVRCCLNETILKKFFPTLEEPGATNDEPGYTETFLGTIISYPDGDATLIVDPELLDAIEWSDPSDPGAWIELPEGTVVTSHDRPEEIAEIIDTLIINAIQQNADRTQGSRKRAKDAFLRAAKAEAEKYGIDLGPCYEILTGGDEPWIKPSDAKWYGWKLHNFSCESDPLPIFYIPPTDFRDPEATRAIMSQLRLWLKQQAK